MLRQIYHQVCFRVVTKRMGFFQDLVRPKHHATFEPYLKCPMFFKISFEAKNNDKEQFLSGIVNCVLELDFASTPQEASLIQSLASRMSQKRFD